MTNGRGAGGAEEAISAETPEIEHELGDICSPW